MVAWSEHWLRWYPLAKREWHTLAHTRVVWLVTMFQVLLGYHWLQQPTTVQTALGPTLAVAAAQPGVAYGVPLAALACTYRSIVGERESGTIRVTTGTHITRHDFLLGTLAGTIIALLLPVVIGVALTILTGIVLTATGLPAFSTVVLFYGATLLYLVVWIGLGIAISALVRTSTQALAVSICLLFFGVFAWPTLSKPLFAGIRSLVGFSEHTLSALSTGFARLGLTNAFLVLTNALFDMNSRYLFDLKITIIADMETNPLVQQFGTPLPVYVQPWFSGVVLTSWAAIPFAIAWHRIATVDLPMEIPTLAGRLRTAIHTLGHRRKSSGRLPLPSLTGFDWLHKQGVRWAPLAKREYQMVRHSLASVVIFGLILGIGLLDLPSTRWLRDAIGPAAPIAAFQRAVGFVVLASALVLTFRAVAGERDSGSITLTMGTAVTRVDIVVGKLVGRALAICIPVYAALLVGVGYASIRYGLPPIGMLSGFALVVAGYIVVCAGIGVSISAVAASTTRSGITSVVFVLGTILWFNLGPALYLLVTGQTASLFFPPADPALFLSRRVTVLESFCTLTNAIFRIPNASFFYDSVLKPANTTTNVLVVGETFTDSVPVYLRPWFAGVVLLAWFVVPLTSALLYTRRGDLT